MMSTHTIPQRDDTDRLRALVLAGLREPSNVTGAGGAVTFIFAPDLTTEEAARFADLVNLSRALVLDPDDYALIKAQVPALAAFMTGTPTQAQTIAALRSVIRVLRAILRDG